MCTRMYLAMPMDTKTFRLTDGVPRDILEARIRKLCDTVEAAGLDVVDVIYSDEPFENPPDWICGECGERVLGLGRECPRCKTKPRRR